MPKENQVKKYNKRKKLIFYLIFCAVLIGFFAIMLIVFYQTKWELDNGLVGSNPGLSFRPMPPDSSALIWYKSSDKENVHYWQKQLRIFLTDTTIICKDEEKQSSCGHIIGSNKHFYPIVPFKGQMFCGHHSIEQFQNHSINYRDYWWENTQDFLS